MNFIESIQAGFRTIRQRLRPRAPIGILVLDALQHHRERHHGRRGLPGLSGRLARPGAIGANLALLLPSWAVSIRRLHDINRTGYWVLIAFTVIGILLLIYWACLKGTDGDNDYGPDPLRGPAA